MNLLFQNLIGYRLNGDTPMDVAEVGAGGLQLVAATNVTARAGGRFAFEGPPPAYYMVGVLLPSSVGG